MPVVSTSTRFRQFGHFHEAGLVGAEVDFGVRATLPSAGLFRLTSRRATLHSAHNPRPISKPVIDFRDLHSTQYCVVSRSLPDLPRPPLPTLQTLATSAGSPARIGGNEPSGRSPGRETVACRSSTPKHRHRSEGADAVGLG